MWVRYLIDKLDFIKTKQKEIYNEIIANRQQLLCISERNEKY